MDNILVAIIGTLGSFYILGNSCYGAGTDGTVAELKTDVTELLRTCYGP